MKALFLVGLLVSFSAARGAEIEAIGGEQSLKVTRAGKILSLGLKAKLLANDLVESQQSVADIRYEDRSLVRVARHTQYRVETKDSTAEKLVLELVKGALRVLVPEHQDKSKIRLEVVTPQGVVGVRGTEFFVEQMGQKTELYTLHGEVSFATKKNTVLVGAGSKSSIDADRAPSAPEAFSMDQLLKRIEGTSELFGPLAERKHGQITNKTAEKTPPAASSAPSFSSMAPPKLDSEKSKDEKVVEEIDPALLRSAVNRLDLTEVDSLLGKPIDIDGEDTLGNTALHIALLSPKESEDKDLIIHDLLSHGADVDIQNKDGNTPLHLAILKSKNEAAAHKIIIILNSESPDLSLKNKDKMTAKQLAHKFKYRSVEALLSGQK